MTVQTLNQLIGRIKEDIVGLEKGVESDQIRTHFANTLAHLELRRSAGAAAEEGARPYDDLAL